VATPEFIFGFLSACEKQIAAISARIEKVEKERRGEERRGGEKCIT
jgi:hypothetical protein